VINWSDVCAANLYQLVCREILKCQPIENHQVNASSIMISPFQNHCICIICTTIDNDATYKRSNTIH
jgi:hypothetical protein